MRMSQNSLLSLWYTLMDSAEFSAVVSNSWLYTERSHETAPIYGNFTSFLVLRWEGAIWFGWTAHHISRRLMGFCFHLLEKENMYPLSDARQLKACIIICCWRHKGCQRSTTPCSNIFTWQMLELCTLSRESWPDEGWSFTLTNYKLYKLHPAVYAFFVGEHYLQVYCPRSFRVSPPKIMLV